MEGVGEEFLFIYNDYFNVSGKEERIVEVATLVN